ncbi:MAG: AAA family ATPase, partial [Ruminiclostridium sp.]|nr:AAA family ATPase [Ruminiclostridium sp.]
YVVGKKSHTFKMFDEIKTILGINPAKTIPVDKMYLICDAFYYEFAAVKKAKGEDEIDDSDVLTYDEIDQINRVRSAESLFDGGMTSNYIKVTPSSDDTVEKYDDYIEKVKNGEMIVGYQWSDAQQEKIPDMSFLDSFVPTTEYVELCDMVYTNMSAVVEDMANDVPILDTVKAHHVNSILLGKPGTGKTSIAYALGAAFQMPVYTVINSKNTEEDNFEGKNKVINGEITFCSTPFLEAFKNGGIVVLEEFNLAAPDVIMGALGQAVEAPFILFEDGYKEVRRHPLCVILATMNVGTSGSKEPSEAFVSRFPEVYILNDPNEKDFVNILMSSGSSEVDCHNVYDAYSSVQMHLEDKGCDDIALSLTMRHCFAALKALGRGIPFKKAVQKTIINAIGVKDLELAREVYETVIEPMVLKSA